MVLGVLIEESGISYVVIIVKNVEVLWFIFFDGICIFG